MTLLPKPVLEYRRVAPPMRLPRYLGLRAPARRPLNWLFLTIVFALLSLAVFVIVTHLK